jgi:uncharacterized protein YlaI
MPDCGVNKLASRSKLGRRRFVYRAWCDTCGWIEEYDDDTVAFNAVKAHTLEHQTGAAIVMCDECGDHVPASTARYVQDNSFPVTELGTMGPVAHISEGHYICGDCDSRPAPVLVPVDPVKLRDDLVALERELRN